MSHKNLETNAILSENSSQSLLSGSSDIPPKIFLKPLYFALPDGKIFLDKHIPKKYDKTPVLCKNIDYPPEYFVSLHFCISSFNTYNHLGARMPLPHNKLKVDKFREFLPKDYDDLVILQYVEYSVPFV